MTTLDVPSPRRARRPRTLLLRPAAAIARRRPVAAAMSRPQRIALVTCLGLLLTTVWALLFALVFSGVAMNIAQQKLYGELRGALANQTAPIGAEVTDAGDVRSVPIRPGAPEALMAIPAIGIGSMVVVEGTSSSELSIGPGHRADTPLPGQVGTSVVYGKGVTFGGPFRRLVDLQPGDPITVTTQQGTFVYAVDAVLRPGDPVPSTFATAQVRLTLETMVGTGWRAGWAPNQPLYVAASLRSGTPKPFVTPANTALPARDLPMATDTRWLNPLVLWLELLLATGVLAVWARRRWGRWQTWLVSMPVGAAALWGTTVAVSRMLPNMF